jgi:hypothetical protein
MYRAMLRDHLAEAERHVASGERIVARQKILVAEMICNHRDSHEAKSLLVLFEKVLSQFLADRNRLRAALAKRPGAPPLQPR